jgi:hypothetical protein
VKHSERMMQIASALMPPKWSTAFSELERSFDAAKNDPQHMRLLKRCWLTASATLTAQLTNGAGRDGDQILRYFLSDVCNRFWQLGPWDSAPSSFNVTSDFLRYLPDINSHALLQEVDHEFELTDFLDFVTDPREELTSPTLHALVPEATIHHFTNTAPLHETTVGDSRTQRFAVASCSLVRHETEVSLCLVAGQPISAARGLPILDSPEKLVVTDIKSKLRDIMISEPRKAAALRDDGKWWKVVLLMRLDLKQSAAEVRYVLRDCGDVFDLFTDDASTFFDSQGRPVSSNWETILRRNVERLDEFGPLFELAQYCMFLPRYFSVRGSQAKTIRTEFGQLQGSTKFRRRVAAARSHARVAHRTLLQAQPSSMLSPNLMVAPASLRIERTGYWKTLRADQSGVDRQGRPAKGKTWVTKELTWIENATPTQDLRIESGAEAEGPDPGYVYVLRNAAHPEDVFKVGLTRRGVNARADELSASSGAPDKFLVVQRWNSRDCKQAEAAIHAILDQHRLAGRREFFKAPYEVIRMAVERVLSHECIK